ncbi:MAG: hypothetical protein A3D28_00225 [Omnitrophica bacterium RIFCSPHIGHO2_02_FULL_63_14]|nr:MAG: hypothetical protein A3D28_00225 [Omnitrophica bacterium RIFCSPHIGHO2_02_FULL_63_14]
MRTAFLIAAALMVTSMAAYADDEAWKAWEAKHAHLKPWMDANNDGTIDAHEKELVRMKWKHLNPPGPKGGKGASPNRAGSAAAL